MALCGREVANWCASNTCGAMGAWRQTHGWSSGADTPNPTLTLAEQAKHGIPAAPQWNLLAGVALLHMSTPGPGPAHLTHTRTARTRHTPAGPGIVGPVAATWTPTNPSSHDILFRRSFP
eukprot:860648-Prymnesium_polylepis.1